jgi:transcriptional regulator with XRE-family HTH domain
MVNSADFAKRLQIILEFYGLSATAFSEEIDFNRSTISHLISGRNKPSLEFVMKVIQKFPDVELYWLLNGKGSFPSETVTDLSPSLKLDAKENKGSSDTSAKKRPNLPQNTNPSEIAENSKDIERIVIFYKDGRFKTYEN